MLNDENTPHSFFFFLPPSLSINGLSLQQFRSRYTVTSFLWFQNLRSPEMVVRRVPLTLFFFLYLFLSSQVVDVNGFRRRKHKIDGPIKTLVVIVMENRSFDHVLGWLKATRPDIDGLTGNESNTISVSDPDSPKVPVSDDSVYVDSDPGHSFQAIREQIFGSNDSSANPSPMNGFVQQAESMAEGMSRIVMSGFKPELVPVYTELANEFAVFDKWFASVPASTQPNPFYIHSVTSHGAMSNVRKDLIHGFPQKTIFDSLKTVYLDRKCCRESPLMERERGRKNKKE